MKKSIFFITCLVTLGMQVSHGVHASPVYTSREERCETINYPYSEYTRENSSIEMEEDIKEEEIVEDISRLQLALARICVSESGFQIETNDCLMIYHVLRNRSRSGEITMGIMRSYATKSFNMHREDNRRWISHLRSDFREPRHWSDTTRVPWSSKRDRWIEVYEYAGILIRTNPVSPCMERIDHWGARYFRRRQHIRNGWIPLNCGETMNQFWSLPRRERIANDS